MDDRAHEPGALVGREDRVKQMAKEAGIDIGGGIEIINAALSRRNAAYAAYLYERLQRKGFLQRDCQRLVNQDRNHFASCMIALGDADAMVTGVTRNFSVALEDVRRCIDAAARHSAFILSTSCEIPPKSSPEIVKWFMDAAREYGRYERIFDGAEPAPTG